MSDIDENSDCRLSDTSEKYEGTEHYTLVKTKDGWHGYLRRLQLAMVRLPRHHIHR